MNNHLKRSAVFFLSAFIYIIAAFFPAMETLAAPVTYEDFQQAMEERKSLPIQSNQIENWPDGPAIGAESAILLEANTGVVLYSKNIHEKLYPASTTKLMTALLAAENCSMDETVAFSHNAVFSIELGSSNIGIDAGQAMPMEECLYGILVASANEVANAIAEHVAGSLEAFADKMNEKAKELGCKDTHFVNAHGLFDENHYTSANDLALIARAVFQNELLSRLGNTPSHHFIATASQPDDFTVKNKHQLITGELPYEGIKGGKTGYTSEARQTLVTCAEKNGMKLICVVMMEESPEQFHDTVKLFDYGFTNFAVTNVSENETRYNIDNSSFFHTSYDVFGNSKPILALNQNSCLILPKTVDFEDLAPEVFYDTAAENEVARIDYYYHKVYVGTASIDLNSGGHSSYDFNSEPVSYEDTLITEQTQAAGKTIFINVKLVLIVIVIVAVILIVLFVIRDIIINYSFFDNVRSRQRKARRKNRKTGPKW